MRMRGSYLLERLHPTSSYALTTSTTWDIVPSFIKITFAINVGGITAMTIIFLHDNVIYFAVEVGPPFLIDTKKVELDDVE